MRIKKRFVLMMIIVSLFISTSLIGCDKKEVNNNTIKNVSSKNDSENCGSVDDDKGNYQIKSKPPK